MVTLRDKGSDTVRLKSGSSHMDIKEKSIWVVIKRRMNHCELLIGGMGNGLDCTVE